MAIQNETRRAGGATGFGDVNQRLADDARTNSPSPSNGQHSFVLSNPKRLGRGTLVGSFDLEMPSGLVVRGAMLFEKGSRRWVNFPSKEWTKSDGTKGYFPLLEFASREISDKFQTIVVPLAENLFRLHSAERDGPEPADTRSKQERSTGQWAPGGGPSDDIDF
jgi:hypothetical protein